MASGARPIPSSAFARHSQASMNVESSAIAALAAESPSAKRRSCTSVCASHSRAISEAGSSTSARALRSCAAA